MCPSNLPLEVCGGGTPLVPAPDLGLISDGSLRRKSNGCTNYISVIRLFIRGCPKTVAISKIGTSRVKLGSGTAAGAIVYVDVNTAGLRSWKPPVAVQGKDAH